MLLRGEPITGPVTMRQPRHEGIGILIAGIRGPIAISPGLAAVLARDEDLAKQDHGAGCHRDGH